VGSSFSNSSSAGRKKAPPKWRSSSDSSNSYSSDKPKKGKGGKRGVTYVEDKITVMNAQEAESLSKYI